MPLSGQKRRSSRSPGPIGGSTKKYRQSTITEMSGAAGYRRMRRKVYKGARKLRQLGRFGGMVATRNLPAAYVGPSNTLGTLQSAAGTGGAGIGTVGWALGSPVVAGGLVAGLYDVPFSVFNQLNQVINFTDFQALFDQYQIRSVSYYITLSAAAVSVQGAAAGNTILAQPSIMYFPDYDDSNLPSMADVRERMGVRQRTLSPGRTVRITVRNPKCDMIVLAGGAPAGGGIPGRGAQWLDTAQTQVPHFGLKGMFKGLDLTAKTTPSYQITIETKVKFALKQVK